MERQDIPELLDDDVGTATEVSASLQDLRWFNRYFGGLTTTYSLLDRVARALEYPDQLSFLDVAGASGEGAVYSAQRLADSGSRLRVTVLNRCRSHMAPNGSGPAVTRLCGDALALPFRDGSFDVVGSSLFVHHLAPLQVIAFVADALRVCRSAVIINDLIRSWPHYLVALAGRPLYQSRLTRHDAPASVRRAYTPSELLPLLQQTPAARIEISSHYFCRLGAILWK